MQLAHYLPVRRPLIALLGALCCAAAGLTAGAQTTPQTVTMWSHWPDEASKRGFVEERVKRFEAATPQCKVNLQFIQKSDLYASVKTSVRTGQAPDIFWLEPDEIAFAKSGYLEPLNSHININNLEDWARGEWTLDGKVYGLPVEAYTVELYYNKDLLKKVGVELPAGMQLTQAQFTDLVKKATAAGITPLANGVGDRPYPGAYLLQEVLLRKLGTDDYKLLLTGKLSFTDPRVIEAMTWVKQLVDAGAYPKSFATMKLGESHYYFHTNPGALMFPIASWYTGRAFVAPEKGGQPKGFPLGIMKYPTLDNSKCPECKTLAVGGSYVMYSRSKNKDCAGKLMNSIATVDNGTRWLEDVLLQTGIKSDANRMQGIWVPYFKELQERSKGARFFVGTPLHYLSGKCADTFSQVLNRGFPGGQVSVQDAAAQMDAACKSAS
ncbi:ABC transporter substrate-binding protein [Ramlibacter sp. WS9]|uniref:ABC transporter substrate-binding protein n=1 Tax=Ramlibacter sp. WS9 TaxID=1882741 RepID=UPI001144F9F8|nr:extracellular solute-binding protein [Ramlibacter sp. WS9]ROZ77606.1 extracellular solute-binding protein [Ramlibacter sp. WS9]